MFVCCSYVIYLDCYKYLVFLTYFYRVPLITNVRSRLCESPLKCIIVTYICRFRKFSKNTFFCHFLALPLNTNIFYHQEHVRVLMSVDNEEIALCWRLKYSQAYSHVLTKFARQLRRKHNTDMIVIRWLCTPLTQLNVDLFKRGR